jgi:parallel beta-helix repeat protein
MFMKRLLSHVVTRVKESWNRPTSRPQHFTQLKLERLEDRLVPSTTEYVVPGVYGGNVYGDFGSAYNAAQPGDTIQLEPGATIPGGTINMPLTIQGDPNYYANNYTVTGNVEVAPGGSGTTFSNLDFSQSTLRIDTYTNNVGVEYSLVGQLNSYGDNAVIYGNTIQGGLTFLSIVGYGGYNNVSGNTFVGNGAGLVMAHGANDAVYNNTFQVSSYTAIGLFDEQGAVVGYNQIYNTGVPDAYGILVENAQSGQSTNVQIVGNLIQTGNQGVALATINATRSTSMFVTAQGNYFDGNAVGVLVDGDGKTSANINLGGEYGIPGGNDFSDYQGGDGRLAIAVVNTNADNAVWAEYNTWGTYTGNVVKDSIYNTYQQTTPDYTANQTGTGFLLF